jgi:glycosyltransferase involved in cell wall biosynthesis
MHMSQYREFNFLFASAMFTGNEVYFQNIRDAVTGRDDVNATWLPIELDPRELIARIPPFSLNYSLKNGAIARSRLSLLEKSGKTFDAAFINHVTPASFLSGFMKRVPTILSLDATPVLLDRYSTWYELGVPSPRSNFVERAKHRFTQNIYGCAAIIVAWSSLVKSSLMADYGIPEEKIKVVPPGIDLRIWGNPPLNGAQSRNGSRRVRILFVGGHFLRKGGDILLGLARRDEFASCEFHVVTRSFQGVPPGNVVVHSTVCANSETLRALYQDADIFCLPTRADFSPLAVCEAMASGLPAVVTDAGGLSEFVEDGRCGFVVPVDDVEAIARRLGDLVTNSELRGRMGTASRARAGEMFDLEKNASTLVELLKGVSGPRRSPQSLLNLQTVR